MSSLEFILLYVLERDIITLKKNLQLVDLKIH